MIVPGASKAVVFEEKRSKFISQCWHVTNREEADAILSATRAEHSTARHVVYAFVIGPKNSECLGMSDDGEPKGTSGRPSLEVLRGSGFRDILLTIVRYFGGIKLGTGGLVRAYSQSAKLAIEQTERIEQRTTLACQIDLSYDEYNKFQWMTNHITIEILSEVFSERVVLQFRVDEADKMFLEKTVLHITRGNATIEQLETDQ